MRLPHHCSGLFIIAWALVVVTGAIGTSGCTVTWGTPLPTDGLETLEIQKSNRADVLLALGAPRGEGEAEFSQQAGRPRDLWFYDYSRGSGSQIHASILVVFFENDLYDGHWWYASDVE